MITAAAVKYRGKVYSLPPPARHHNVLWDIHKQTDEDILDSRRMVQGFIDDKEGFVNRERAWRIVIDQRQPLAPHQVTGKPRREPDIPFTLFSEDVW